jgi:hypothetical protein
MDQVMIEQRIAGGEEWKKDKQLCIFNGVSCCLLNDFLLRASFGVFSFAPDRRRKAF